MSENVDSIPSLGVKAIVQRKRLWLIVAASLIAAAVAQHLHRQAQHEQALTTLKAHGGMVTTLRMFPQLYWKSPMWLRNTLPAKWITYEVVDVELFEMALTDDDLACLDDIRHLNAITLFGSAFTDITACRISRHTELKRVTVVGDGITRKAVTCLETLPDLDVFIVLGAQISAQASDRYHIKGHSPR